MPASYPGAVKSFTTKVNGVDAPDANHINDLQLEVEAIETDLRKLPIDYSAISTIVGWSSFTMKILSYLQLGKLVFVEFHLAGTSNSATTTITLPFAVPTGLDLHELGYAVDNGGAAVVGKLYLTGSTLSFAPTVNGAFNGWTASGTKVVRGSIFYLRA